MNKEQLVAFQGEVMLLQWGESNTRGRTVTFLLTGEGDAHPFKEFTVKGGKKAGQRFAAVLVEIDEDETPVKRTRSQVAYLLCKDPQFWQWASEHSFMDVKSENDAREFVLETCRVKSRSEIDKAPHASALWDAMVVDQFDKYRSTVNSIL